MPAYIKASLKRSFAEGFLNELENNTNQYFLFIGKATPWTNENVPSSFTDTVSGEYEASRNIVGYKKINPANVLFAIPRYTWTYGTVYDTYDDAVDIFNDDNPKIFYVITDENKIYKCLDKPSATTKSTEKPTSVLSYPFKTYDGYVWKYLATVKESNTPYSFSDYIPIDFADVNDTESTNQYAAQAQSVEGSITKLEFVTNSGASAAVYQYAEIPSSLQTTPRVGDYKEFGNRKFVFLTSGDNSKLRFPSNMNNYLGYSLRISKSLRNASEENNYGVIVAAGSTGAANELRFFELRDAGMNFTVTPSLGSADVFFHIVPTVKIMGNGSGAYAFPILDSQRKITGVELVDGGSNYSQATATITTAKDAANKVHPTFRTILSPKGGHGSNVLKELNVQDIIVIVPVGDDDVDTILPKGSYRQFGIVKNPEINNGLNTIAGKDDLFYRDIVLLYTGGNTALLEKEQAKNLLFTGMHMNIIVGAETSVGSSVSELKSISTINGETRFTVKITNVGGRYLTYNDRKRDFEITFSTEAAASSYIVGETIYQVIPSGTIGNGFTIRAEGVVLSKSGVKIRVRTTKNGFVVSQQVVGIKSRSYNTPSKISPVYGEPVCIYDTNTNSLYSENGDREVFRVIDLGTPYFELNETPSFSGLTVLHISTSSNASVGFVDTTTAAVTQTSFTSGSLVQQGISGDALSPYASGTVYDWEYVNPSYGRLYLTDVFGQFRNVEDHGLTGATMGAFIVSKVDPPEIDPKSGEILYINNIRPVSRVVGQEEEFRIRLGF